jgi:DNA-binding transcriptional LysR family regulator
MRITNLDTDALRSFVTGMEVGSFARAADRLGRSTSAVSAQLKKLEEQAGVPLVRKSGRGLALTDGGEALLSYARRLLELNDEAVTAVRGVELEGWVRLGLQEDFGETVLPQVLGRFARAHPKVRIEGRIGRNQDLVDMVEAGRLDLALAWDDGIPRPTATTLAALPLCWLGSAETPPNWQLDGGEPLPLAALEAPCMLRTIACESLDRHGLSWRIAFVSPSLAGIWAATAAGLGIALRTPVGWSPSIRILDPVSHRLPALPKLGLVLHKADRDIGPTGEHLASIIGDALGEILSRDWLSNGHA